MGDPSVQNLNILKKIHKKIHWKKIWLQKYLLNCLKWALHFPFGLGLLTALHEAGLPHVYVL